MYSKEIWDEVIRLRLEEGRTLQSLSKEFGINAATIGRRIRKLKAEAQADQAKAEILTNMEEIRRLRDELAEVRKENDFLKKLAAFYAKETR